MIFHILYQSYWIARKTRSLLEGFDGFAVERIRNVRLGWGISIKRKPGRPLRQGGHLHYILRDIFYLCILYPISLHKPFMSYISAVNPTLRSCRWMIWYNKRAIQEGRNGLLLKHRSYIYCLVLEARPSSCWGTGRQFQTMEAARGKRRDMDTSARGKAAGKTESSP